MKIYETTEVSIKGICEFIQTITTKVLSGTKVNCLEEFLEKRVIL